MTKLALLIVAGCGGHRAPPPRAPPAAGCRAATGCPRPHKLRPCDYNLAAQPLADVLRLGGELSGGRVIVRGTLEREPTLCTMKLCRGGCCNHCGAALVLGDATARLRLAGAAVACAGDESLVCCPFELAGTMTVVAQGTLVRDGSGGWRLDDAQLCAP